MTEISAASPGARQALLAWAGAAAACLAIVVLSYFFVDRPMATFVHEHFHGSAGFVWLTHIPEPLPPLAALALAAIAIASAAGARLRGLGVLALRCSLSLLAALAIKDQLKYAFGRTWPETWVNDNPSFIGSGAYGFTPFHGGVAYSSFPSGHTTAIFAVVAVLWAMEPRWRWLYGGVAALVMIGLIGADYHWVSDVIAGAFLGSAAGATAATIGRQKGE